MRDSSARDGRMHSPHLRALPVCKLMGGNCQDLVPRQGSNGVASSAGEGQKGWQRPSGRMHARLLSEESSPPCTASLLTDSGNCRNLVPKQGSNKGGVIS